MDIGEIIEEAQGTPEFQAESLFLDFGEVICEEMAKQDISKADMARRMKKSRAYITRALSGNYGYPTIRTMSKFAVAVGVELTITLNPPTGGTEDE